MKRFTLIIIVSLFHLFGFSQGSIVLTDKPFLLDTPGDTALTNWLNTYPEYSTCSKEEREAIFWINLARSKPKLFVHNILVPFLEQFPEVKNSYTRSLISDLSALEPLNLLAPSASLIQIAGTHAKDLGANQRVISHNSSKGLSFRERMNRAGYIECISENIYEGKENGLFSVLFLLIDTGVKSLGHRKNILDPQMKYIGVSFYPVKGKKDIYYSVQNFSCK